MQRSRFSGEQFIGVLTQAEAGIAVLDPCRQHRISQQTYYRRKNKVRRLRGEQSPGDDFMPSLRLGVPEGDTDEPLMPRFTER